jgi:hypothetical protein
MTVTFKCRHFRRRAVYAVRSREDVRVTEPEVAVRYHVSSAFLYILLFLQTGMYLSYKAEGTFV